MTSGQRPDVVPGNAIEPAATFHEPVATGLSPSELSYDNSSMPALNQGIIIYKKLIEVCNYFVTMFCNMFCKMFVTNFCIQHLITVPRPRLRLTITLGTTQIFLAATKKRIRL